MKVKVVTVKEKDEKSLWLGRTLRRANKNEICCRRWYGV